jgi:hypothetical protein
MAKNEEKEDRKSYTYVPFWSTQSKCYEAVQVDGKDVFLTFSKGKFEIIDELELGDGQYFKPVQHTERKYSFTQEQIDSAIVPGLSQLYENVYWFFRNYFSHFDQRVQKFLALYIVHGYVLTRSPGTIFVWLVGQKRTGKTTAQLIAEALGYRAFSGVAPSEAALYRTLGYEVEYGPLIICREYEHASDVMKEIIREGDIPGASVPRADKFEDRFVVNHYRLYGSRLNSSNALHGNEADADRYCVIKCAHLRPPRPRAELYRNKEVMNRIRETRNSLLLWKLTDWQELKFPLEDPAGEIVEGRDWEHYGGLITLANMVSAELGREIRDFVNERLEEVRKEEKYQLRAQIVEIVKGLADEKHTLSDGRVRIEFNEVWSRLKADCTPFIENGVEVKTKLIGSDGEVITTHQVGKIVREQLFGERHVWKDEQQKNVKGYVWPAEKFQLAFGTPATVLGVATVSTVFMTKETEAEKQNLKENEQHTLQTAKNTEIVPIHNKIEPPDNLSIVQKTVETVAERKTVAETVVVGDGICELCGQPGSLTKDSDGHFVCSICLKETQPSMIDEPQPPGPQGNIAKITTPEQSDKADALPRGPSQPIPVNAQNMPYTDTAPLGAYGAARRSGLIYPRCSVCGKELGKGDELSVYTIDKKHYCRNHFQGLKEAGQL